MVKNDTYLPSTTPPRLPFARPWAKIDSVMDQELLQCFTPQKYTCVQTRYLFWIRMNYSNYRLTHITFYHGAYGHHLGLEQLKNRMVKSSAMFQALRSTIILEFLQDFQIKLRDSYVWPSQVSPLWYFWILTKALMVYAFSLLSLHLISLYGVHRWGDKKNILANIYCTVNPWI
jgi:hypothetical protein